MASAFDVSIHAPREGRDLPGTAVPVFENEFQSTRPVKGATLGERQRLRAAQVSIHAPREGRDLPEPLEGERATVFQSTRPVKGATR